MQCSMFWVRAYYYLTTQQIRLDMKDIDQELLKRLFRYEDGQLIRKCRVANQTKGSVIGYKLNTGYVMASVNKKLYVLHRLVFLYHHGYAPKYIDHINGNRSDNRIENLRECTRGQNIMNSKLHKNNKSGVKGVHWSKKYKKWVARVNVDKRPINVGYFNSLEDAEKAVNKAREKFHGDFCRHK